MDSVSSTSRIEYEDGRSYDPQESKNIIKEWVDTNMQSRESEFTKSSEATIFCGTWNVNAKKQEGNLQEWIMPAGTPQCDLYAVGFQEIVDLNAMNVALNSSNTQQKAVFWRETLVECLRSSRSSYQLVAEKHLVGVLLLVFAKESMCSFIKDVRTSHTAVGIMGVLGNKGGVGIRFSLYDSPICIICAHLAAHQVNVQGRNSDYKNIYEKTRFSTDKVRYHDGDEIFSIGSGEFIAMPRIGAAQFAEVELGIVDHDIIFWIGDLNYRIDSFSAEEVLAKIEAREWETLRGFDQLNTQRDKGNAFGGFEEGSLTFPPTYKYQPGTDKYETRVEKKLRSPAWCDRVLWKAKRGDAVHQLAYNRGMLNPSDHKPVYSVFSCNLKTVVEHDEERVFKELLSILKKANSEDIPVVQLKGLNIVFDKVNFDVPCEARVNISNVGASLVRWRLVAKLGENHPHKEWVRFDKSFGLLLPGESIQLCVTVHVDKRAAQSLSARRDILQDTVILRVEKSVDHHIAINAFYSGSSFGMCLEDLVRSPQPICRDYDNNGAAAMAEFTAAAFLESSSSTATAETGADCNMSVPKEVWRLIDALWTGGALREDNLFAIKGDIAEIAIIVKCLDSGTEFPHGLSIHSYVDVLSNFIGALGRPLIPFDLFPVSELDGAALRVSSRKLLEDLPVLHYNTLVYVLSFLREVLVESAHNKCDLSMIAAWCLSCMTSAGIPTIMARETATATPASGNGNRNGTASGKTGSSSGSSTIAVATMRNEKYEKDAQRRATRQSYLLGILSYLLSTPVL